MLYPRLHSSTGRRLGASECNHQRTGDVSFSERVFWRSEPMPLLSVTQLLSLCLVLAVALSTPVIGWCAAAKHQGQGLHALFAHVHEADVPTEHVAMDHTTALTHSHPEPGTSWSVSSAFGTAGSMDGIEALAPSLPPTIVSAGRARFSLGA